MGLGSKIKGAFKKARKKARQDYSPMAVLKNLNQSMEGINNSIDDNRWLKLASVALGGDKYRTGLRMLEDGKWSTTAALESGSPVAAYRGANRDEKTAAKLAERGAEAVGMTNEDAVVSEIRRAYGMENDGNPTDQINAWIANLDGQLDQPNWRFPGAQREQATQTRSQLQSVLAQYEKSVAGSTAQKGRQAIDAIGRRSAAMAKRDATRELDTRLASDVSRQNAAAFTRGVSGSSFDQAARAKQLTDYSLGRSGIANTLAESDRNFRDTLDTQRRSLEDRARAVGRSAIDPSAIAVNQTNAARDAFSNLGGRSLGQLLATSSDLVVNDQVQRAQGNLGFRGLAGATPFTASRSSGGRLSR